MPNGIDLGPAVLTQCRTQQGGYTAPGNRSNTDVGDRQSYVHSSYKLMGLYYRQLSARSRLISSATSNASYCLRYWETQLGKTTLNNYGTVVAKKTISSAFSLMVPDPKTFRASSTQTQRCSRSGVPRRGYSGCFCP